MMSRRVVGEVKGYSMHIGDVFVQPEGLGWRSVLELASRLSPCSDKVGFLPRLEVLVKGTKSVFCKDWNYR